MSLSITELQPKDQVSKVRTVYNQNFKNVKDVIDSIESLLDYTNNTLTISDVTVNRGSRALSTEILVVDGSGRYKGTISVEGTILGSNVYLSNSAKLTLVSGNINLTGANSNFNLDGSAYFDGVVALKNFNATALNGSNIGTYSNVSSNVGTYSANNKHALTFDFSNYSSSANVLNTNTVKEIKLSAPQYNNQILYVVVNAASSTGKPHNILSNNIVSLSTSQKIQFQEDYGVLQLVGSGNSWIVTSLIKANIV